MKLELHLRRSLVAAALVALLGAAAANASDETTIAIKTRAGTIERVDAGDLSTLAPNETRALTTRSGSAATITRTGHGLLLAIAGDQYPIDVPAGAGELAGLDPLGQHVDGDGHEVSKVVVLKHGHDEAGDDTAMLDPDELDDEALLAAGDGQRIVVKRRKVLSDAPAQ